MFAPTVAVPSAESGEKVIVGGFPIGIAIDVGGLLVESVTGVSTDYGTAYVEGLQRGDIIKSINGTKITNIDDIFNNITNDDVNITIVRGGEEREITVRPITEAFSGKPRLGIKVKEKIYGVGTCSFVRSDGSYAALGHEIYDGDTGVRLPQSGGKIHSCKILGIKKGTRGEAGGILASITENVVYGTVTVNNNYGIAGKFEAEVPFAESLPLASRDEVTVGPAKIRTSIENGPEYFDIEIIKAARQSARREKGIVFRVTDKRLLSLTGGVVRGMSGSPIIQNGKVIAAVTHVFLNDFTKGYGVYADFLNK
ncbi:MAG: hypothetical protein J1F39_00640 [Clostridiales bacterium]|nr:hypothetical protein [Clostridiales bacterium]